MKTRLLLFVTILICRALPSYSQACTPAGDQTTYGTGNVWKGYVYDNKDLTTYKGYVTEGNAGSPAFDESFGGDNVSYPTNGCPVNTETFSVRYKLTKTFSDGGYEFTVGADDGFRLSLDGGTTWVINKWNDQSYTTATYDVYLNGSYNMVLEYYENTGGNRVSFSVASICMGTEDQSIYGTGNIWKGYVYDGTNFNTYKGLVNEGTASNPDFDESFGGSNTSYPTSNCATQTETFSVRYRLRKTFANSSYVFILGGDDGYRLSLDGGTTWVINKWNDQSYNTSSYFTALNGTYNMVVEYYENGGDNRISFSISGAVLPINLISFDGKKNNNKVSLEWLTTTNSTTDHFEVERSIDNSQFYTIGTVAGSAGTSYSSSMKFTFADKQPLNTTSFYRLKMIDLSGAVSYSKIITLQPANDNSGVEIYPTISSGSFYIRSPKKFISPQISLYDLSGKLIAQKKLNTLAANIPAEISFSNITATGIFLLRLSDNNSTIANQKLIIR